MKKRRLKTLQDLRRWLADAGNRMESGSIDVTHARTVAYLCSVMAGIVKDGDLETRLEALEKAMEKRK